MSEHISDLGNCRSVFPYIGGKTQLAPWIIEHLPDHTCYVEVFGGSASVLVSKEASNVEILNDRDGDIVHFFETFRDRTDELVTYLERTPYSRDVHRKWSNEFYAGYRPDDDVERAARFFYLRFSQFAAKYDGVSGFKSTPLRSVAKQLNKARDSLELYADRMDDVMVENEDYSYIFDRYDGPETVFYCDPPYVDKDEYYSGGGFDHADFANELADLEGDWLVSYTDIPDEVEAIATTVSSKAKQYSRHNGSGKGHKDTTETLTMNFNPDERPAFAGENQSVMGDW